jgi:thiamine biosynthesis lipoprotein
VDENSAGLAMGEVLREFERLHHTYHAWQPSELTALNTAIAAGRSHEVSAELATLIVDAQKIAAAGDYLFDPGIGKLIALWGFQGDEIVARRPDPTQLNVLLAEHPSIGDLRLNNQTITSKNRGVVLDFGGYLKGVALDRAAVILHKRVNQHRWQRDGAGQPRRSGRRQILAGRNSASTCRTAWRLTTGLT